MAETIDRDQSQFLRHAFLSCRGLGASRPDGGRPRRRRGGSHLRSELHHRTAPRQSVQHQPSVSEADRALLRRIAHGRGAGGVIGAPPRPTNDNFRSRGRRMSDRPLCNSRLTSTSAVRSAQIPAVRRRLGERVKSTRRGRSAASFFPEGIPESSADARHCRFVRQPPSSLVATRSLPATVLARQ